MSLKIDYKQIGWRNNPLRSYSRPKMGHVLSRKAFRYESPLARRKATRDAMRLLLALLGMTLVLGLWDWIAG